ncbi:MAG TPA: ribosomal protein L7/L12 [Allosphingosinicella sp.]|nr:ribosomal protein L7/L12 [Allosphingosinicella sp.]
MRNENDRVDAILAGMSYDRKIGVIKLVREVTGLGLAEAKHFIEHLPQTLKRDISEEEGWELHNRFHDLGAQVSTQPSSRP